MPLTLSPCLPTDAPELGRLSAAIWLPTPGNKVAWAKVPESVMIKKYEKGLHDGMTVQKQCKLPQQRHYLKVTDDATGDIAAYALWLYLPEGYCVEDDDEATVGDLPPGANEALLRKIGQMAGELRTEHPGRHEAHWLLKALGTHPRHERRGAGAKLVQWGFPHADAAGLRCYVDASKLGYPLYRKCGFEDVGERSVDLGEFDGGEGEGQGRGLGVQRWVAMVREPGGGSQGKLCMYVSCGC